jgi:hypothetical protein
MDVFEEHYLSTTAACIGISEETADRPVRAAFKLRQALPRPHLDCFAKSHSGLKTMTYTEAKRLNRTHIKKVHSSTLGHFNILEVKNTGINLFRRNMARFRKTDAL